MADTPWHVLGAGSVGTLWACRLARAGLPVRLLLRDAARVNRYQQGPGLRLLEGTHETTFALPAQTAATEEPIARLLLACKAYDAETAVASVRHRLVERAQVLLLQNGLGSQQAVAAALPRAEVFFASTTEGAWQRDDGTVVFAGQGFTWLGSADGAPAPSWLNDLAQAAIPHQWTPEIMTRLWRKLAINCAINPLTVLHQCRNGELHDHSPQVTALCEELTALLQAIGQPDAAHDLHAEVGKVITATAANYSSMYQDVAAGRRTEIAYLIGHACVQAQRAAVPVPTLESLRQALLQALRDKGLPTN
ncbi:putative 2-dehydropantoate 2-reductase [Pseudomonas entomophila]|uniref:putative 2-dehydropantoate 2-reductase n=1 Tax=Pseudomonas sp. RIT-PI-S TaxID=3035295 RepID=UPI0021DB666A